MTTTITTTTTISTEHSSLLDNKASPNDVLPSRKTREAFPVLFEIIGARNLPVTNLETYCVVQYGTRTIHRTKPFSANIHQKSRISRALGLFTNSSSGASDEFRDPIWTIHEDSILTFGMHQLDIDNNKALKITIWARQRTRLGSVTEPLSVGTVRIKAPSILNDCTSERREVPLLTELDEPIYDGRGEPSTLAYQCRIASLADLKFHENWMKVPRASSWVDTEVVPEPGRPRAKLLTDLPEQLIQFSTTGSSSNPLPPPGYVRVKPYPDPSAHPKNREYVSVQDLKNDTNLPSRKWIQAGSRPSSIGRLYLEILSANGLPNVDIGSKVGNVTDPFCSIIYGDAMAQTDVIFDELSPYWPPWSQRAFVFHMQHPSQVLYLAVFGFKGTPLQHRPIGRVEVNPINLHKDTLYNLEYDLYESSHVTGRQSHGKLRIRLRIEIDDERKALLAALRPPVPVYINTARKKSMAVARYTACGEYDNRVRFSLQVLQGYIDEILQGYVRRLLYSFQDGIKSLVLWRDQVTVLGIGIPLFSMFAFVIGIFVVEHPNMIPAMIVFALALVLLEQMNHRISSPSPWRRCRSFSFYLRVLIFGTSGKGKLPNISAFEGAQEFEEYQKAIDARIAKDKEFIQRKEAFERQLDEIESFKLQDSSQPIPMELLMVLGKIQSIVGDFCRLCRFLDAIITWEESDLAFWITLGLLLVAILFVFIPWGWVLLWIGRILVVLFLGPQNRVLDLLYYQYIPTEDQRIYRFFATKMFEARCRQETAGKLKAFRQIIFGKCATFIPSLYWSPHQDFPLASSSCSSFPTTTSRGGKSHYDAPSSSEVETLPVIPGQTLYGEIIPRPKEQFEKNAKESKDSLAVLINTMLREHPQRGDHQTTQAIENQRNRTTYLGVYQDNSLVMNPSVVEEGLEIMEVFDEEAGFLQSVPSYWTMEGNNSGLRNVTSLTDVSRQTSVHDFGDETGSSWNDDDDDDDDHDVDDDDENQDQEEDAEDHNDDNRNLRRRRPLVPATPLALIRGSPTAGRRPRYEHRTMIERASDAAAATVGDFHSLCGSLNDVEEEIVFRNLPSSPYHQNHQRYLPTMPRVDEWRRLLSSATTTTTTTSTAADSMSGVYLPEESSSHGQFQGISRAPTILDADTYDDNKYNIDDEQGGFEVIP